MFFGIGVLIIGIASTDEVSFAHKWPKSASKRLPLTCTLPIDASGVCCFLQHVVPVLQEVNDDRATHLGRTRREGDTAF
jgi:hypothetical protein